jgi:hypothetical protein
VCRGHSGHLTWQCVSFLPVPFRQAHCLRPTSSQIHYQNCWERFNTAIGGSHRRHGWEGLVVMGGVSAGHLPCHTWSAHWIHLRSLWNCRQFLFQMVVTSCNSVQYLWKYGFAQPSDNLYSPWIINKFRADSSEDSNVSRTTQPHSTCTTYIFHYLLLVIELREA